ncbi:MAG: SAM-dependent methyltransferase [Planctomycetaceae bacterium]|nr:SAM-dependent methyltransferase [Planctomycetaceae bacterium]
MSHSTPLTAGRPTAGKAGAAGRFLPWLLLLFVGSGCAALIYEIVWFQLLQLVIGSSAVSMGVLLGTFMGGMCLGSLALSKCIPAQRHPLRVYALLEIGIGLCGLAVLYGMPHVSGLYAAHVGSGPAGIVWRSVIAAICLLPPTILMGATLPAVARWMETTREGVASLGWLYGGNIAGAVLGCLAAGFYLLRVHDLVIATSVAVAINLTVAVIGFALAARAPHRPPTPELQNSRSALAAGSGIVYLVIALSGACALGAEVIWTRLLSLLLGGTVYTFSIILAAFLVGLGIGSSLGSLWAARAVRPRLALGLCQLLLAAAVGWAAWQLSSSLPYWPINPALARNPWDQLQLDLLRAAWVVVPAACLWGASFPLALAAVAARGSDAGQLVGRVYAANTLGAIVGAIGFSVSLVPWVGTQHCQQTLIVLSGVAALLALAPLVLVPPVDQDQGQGRFNVSRTIPGGLSLVAAISLVAAMTWSIPPIPGDLIAYGRYAALQKDMPQILFQGEGMNSSVAVTRLQNGTRNFHVSGKVEASSEPQDMRLQRMLGHIPALLRPHPKTVLVVGCGAGVTAGSFVVHPEVERIVICEIEPLIPQQVVPHFVSENHHVLDDPRVEVVYDDARHFILTTREKFDVITSDPIHPWVKGAATLYTQEYFELCREHLNPGGVLTQWIPLYESTSAAVKSELATLFVVFPNATIWSNDVSGRGYDVVVLASNDPLPVDIDDLIVRTSRDDHELVAQSLFQVGFGSIFDLLGTYAGQASDLKEWLKDADLNLDRNLRLQYLAGFGLNLQDAAVIYDEIFACRTNPGALFVGTESTRNELLRRLGLLKVSQ